MILDFIEIGTSDFNTEIQKKDTKKGLSVEAVTYYIDKLPCKKDCIKINNGISNFNGYITINYLTVEKIEKYELPVWVKGCNSVNHYHPTVSKLLLDKGIEIKDIVTSYQVPCKTLITLMNEYNVKGLYLLKIDTEGHDSIILEHFFENYDKNSLLPHKIIFESNVLTNPKDIEKIITMAESCGYDLISNGNDTVLQLNIQKMNRTLEYSDVMSNYIIEEYPTNYNPEKLPHENSLDAAKEYCIKHRCSGVTYIENRYEVRNGKYTKYHSDSDTKSWILL